MSKAPVIAVFMPYNSLYTNTIILSTIEGLARKGGRVDLFTLNLKEYEDRVPELPDGVNLIDLGEGKIHKIFSRRKFDDFVLPETMEVVEKKLLSTDYSYSIGIDAPGLLYSYFLHLKTGCPYSYESLELHRVGDPGIWTNPEMKILKNFEHSLLPKANLFIIQDKQREDSFFENLRLENRPNVLHFPVSVPDVKVPEKPRYWHKKYSLPDSTKIIFYAGNIHTYYLSYELISSALNFEDDQVLVLHGKVHDKLYQQIEPLLKSNKIILSTDLVEWQKLPELTASADIGLTFYYEYNVNQYLTGRSSNKIAYYSQCGIPTICPNFSTFREVLDQYNNGIYISYHKDLPKAVNAILGNYEYYSKGAREAFESLYDINIYIDLLWEHILQDSINGDPDIDIKETLNELHKQAISLAGPAEDQILIPFIEAHIIQYFKECIGNEHKFALFGAGQHTRWLLNLLEENDIPLPELIIDENPEIESLIGISVVTPQDALTRKLSSIILSTDMHQKIFRERCEQFFSDKIRIVDLYSGFPDGPYPKTVFG